MIMYIFFENVALLLYFKIRVVCKLIEDEDDVHGMEGLFEYIESCLRHKNEMVIYEAASAIVNLKRTR